MAEIEYFPENALFGKYELGKLLGRGAFAKVYHARNIATGQSVAIKVINKKKVAGNSLASNVKREVYIMSRLRHHHIVRLFEVLASKTKIYFVMEFVKGGELFAKVAKKKFSENLGRNYFQQLISAVGYCHSHGVFHRDLKPENLLVDEKGDMKVSDFGLSAVADQIRHDGLLHTLCGTPAYVAPEILLKKGYDGAKVDIWSCGVILFVMTAGFLPFNDPNLMVMYKKIYRGEFRFPKWMSSDLKRFLSRLLDTNHETRITIDGILHDPWFTKGGFDENKFREQQEENEGIFSMAGKEETEKSLHLNAFDLISFSPSLNLSGLLDDCYNGIEDSERFISDEPPERIVEKVEEIGKVENLRSKNRKDWSLELLGYNGNFLVGVEIYRLTESLVIAEVRRRGGDAKTYREVWKTKLRPEILKMTSRQREELVSRD